MLFFTQAISWECELKTAFNLVNTYPEQKAAEIIGH